MSGGFRPLWLKVLISITVTFHLAVVIILANGPSFLARYHQGWLIGYANQLGLNQTWNFFSPDPTHIHYIRYFVHFEDDGGNETRETIEGYLPEDKEKVVIDSSKRRMLHAVRAISLDEPRTERLLAPWLCRSYEGATLVNIKHVMQVLPNLDRAVALPDQSVRDLSEDRPYRELEFDCRKMTRRGG